MSSQFIEQATAYLKSVEAVSRALKTYRDIRRQLKAKADPETEREVLAELARRDRYFLLRFILDRRDMEHQWLYDRVREVERDPDGYLDLWARDHRKSSIITVGGSIQEVLRNPDVTIAIFSHTKPIAKSFLAMIKREFESNRKLRELFPGLFWEKPDRDAPQWSLDMGIVVNRSRNTKESTIEAWGLVDGQPTGKHFDLRIYDDVVAPESVTTPEQIQKTTAAWELSDNLGTVGGRKWHVGTRYSFADTYHSILQRGALKARIRPATDSGRPDGNPVLLTPEQWEEKKRIQGPATIACQMLQNPIAGQQAMFDPKDLMKWEVRPATLNVYIMADPARSRKKGSANTAVAVIGVDAGRNKYLLDGVNHRMDLRGRWEAIKSLRTVWINQPGVQAVHVGYEAYGAEADMDYFHEQMEVEKNPFPIEELRWPRDSEPSKDDRVQRLGPDFRGHKFYVPAVISHHGVPSFWELKEGSAGGLEIHYTEQLGLTSQMKRVAQDSPSRVVRPIAKVDSEGNVYDLTRHFIEQQMLYPFAPLKDLIDAASRVYDMDPRPPIIVDENDTLPEVFEDGT